MKQLLACPAASSERLGLGGSQLGACREGPRMRTLASQASKNWVAWLPKRRSPSMRSRN